MNCQKENRKTFLSGQPQIRGNALLIPHFKYLQHTTLSSYTILGVRPCKCKHLIFEVLYKKTVQVKLWTISSNT